MLKSESNRYKIGYKERHHATVTLSSVWEMINENEIKSDWNDVEDGIKTIEKFRRKVAREDEKKMKQEKFSSFVYIWFCDLLYFFVV